jgi:hypothetical protein
VKIRGSRIDEAQQQVSNVEEVTPYPNDADAPRWRRPDAAEGALTSGGSMAVP